MSRLSTVDVNTVILPGGNFYTFLHDGREVGAEYDPESLGSSVH